MEVYAWKGTFFVGWGCNQELGHNKKLEGAGSKQTEGSNSLDSMHLSYGNSCIHNILWITVTWEARLLHATEIHGGLLNAQEIYPAP